MKIVYMSITGQTRRFVEKLTCPALEITAENALAIEMTENFLLLVPTYEIAMTAPAFDFLDTGKNADYCLGVVGSGNRNFAEEFVFTAKDIAKKYAVPLLYAFEFNGTEEDVKYIQKVVKNLES